MARSMEENVGDFQGEARGVEIGPVCEDDDRQAVSGKAFDDAAKANALAVVPHARVTVVRVEKPSKAILDGRAGSAF